MQEVDAAGRVPCKLDALLDAERRARVQHPEQRAARAQLHDIKHVVLRVGPSSIEKHNVAMPQRPQRLLKKYIVRKNPRTRAHVYSHNSKSTKPLLLFRFPFLTVPFSFLSHSQTHGHQKWCFCSIFIPSYFTHSFLFSFMYSFFFFLFFFFLSLPAFIFY